MTDDVGTTSRQIQLAVPEMDCQSCVTKVDSSINQLDGVHDTELNPTTGVATIRFDPSETSADAVIKAVERAGYTVTDRPNEDDSTGVDVAPPTEVWTSTRAMKTWAGAVMLTGGLVLEFVTPGANQLVATVLERPIHLSTILLGAAVVVSGTQVIREGINSARARSLDINLLMGLAIVAATGIGYVFEAATLAVLFNIAELMEDYAMDRARDSLRELMELSPDEATVRRDGQETTVDAESVAVGETVLVRPGEKIPLDGVVLEGESAVDESPITGESVPVDVSPGDEVYAGSITVEGYLEIEVTSTAGDSTLSRIIELVQGAQAEQTDTEQFVDRFAGYYTPVVVLLAILTAALPPLLITEGFAIDVLGYAFTMPGGWRPWFVRGLTLLVIACPCAFVISTPVSVVSGLTSAAKNGVLIKGGTHLEAMGEVDAVAIDKTGTLTRGELAVTDVFAAGDTDTRTVLRRAAAVERRSEHPIATAVTAHATAQGIADFPDVSDFESLTGRGVRGTIDSTEYYVGKPALFEELGFSFSESAVTTDGGTVTAQTPTDGISEERITDLEAEGKTVILVGTTEGLLGIIAIADEVRPGATWAVDRLRQHGIDRVVMLTGDNEGTARAIAETAGVDSYRAELLPEEKVEAVNELQTEVGTVAMVGDGINDAPALATADIGIAMGAAGTDTALETADVALMGDDIRKLPYLYALSTAATGVIRQNIGASLGVKAILAVGVPIGVVGVATAVIVGDMGMSLGVTGNAMRLSRVTPETES